MLGGEGEVDGAGGAESESGASRERAGTVQPADPDERRPGDDEGEREQRADPDEDGEGPAVWRRLHVPQDHEPPALPQPGPAPAAGERHRVVATVAPGAPGVVARRMGPASIAAMSSTSAPRRHSPAGRKHGLLAVAAVALVALGGALGSRGGSEEPAGDVRQGAVAPAVRLPATTGGTVDLADFRGKRNVLLYFYEYAG